jgi:uncharacterized membrane protein YbhN (UPF0104 family)
MPGTARTGDGDEVSVTVPEEAALITKDSNPGARRRVLPPVASSALTVGSAGVVAAVVWSGRAEVPAALRTLRSADARWLAVGTAVLVCWWLGWLLLHLAARRLAGAGGYHEAVPLAAVSTQSVALNLAVKSGALAGLAPFLRHARRRGQPPGRVTGSYLLVCALVDLAFTGVLTLALVLAGALGSLTRTEIAVAAAFAVGVGVRLAVLVAVLGDRQRMRSFWAAPQRWWHRIRRRPMPPAGFYAADDLYAALLSVRTHPARALPALGFATVIDVLGAAMLWAALAAVGGGSRPVLALIAYAVSGVLGIVGFLPGGVGFVEIGAVAVLSAGGVSLSVAVAAVLLFRVWDFWLPLLAGGLLAARPRRGGAPAVAALEPGATS